MLLDVCLTQFESAFSTDFHVDSFCFLHDFYGQTQAVMEMLKKNY